MATLNVRSLVTTEPRGAAGKGVIGQSVKDEDELDMMILPAGRCIRCCSSRIAGRCIPREYMNKPNPDATEKGMPIVNLLALEPRERITGAVAVPDFKELLSTLS